MRCLDELALAPGVAAYVGDSPIDIEAGRAAGVTTIGVLTGTCDRAGLEPSGADCILDSAVELAELLGAPLSRPAAVG